MRSILTALLLTCSLLLQASGAAADGPSHTHAVYGSRHYLGGWTRITQYVQCCITASGSRVFYGEVAAPYWIPLHAHVVIPGLGTFVVLDRGAFNDNHLDLWVPYYPYSGIPDWRRGVYWTA